MAPEGQPLKGELSALDATGYRFAVQDAAEMLVGLHCGVDGQPNGNRSPRITEGLILFRAYNSKRLVDAGAW